jgi:hypothetical protein
VFIREAGELTGTPFGALRACFPAAIPLAIVRPEARSYVALVAPPPESPLLATDRVALLAYDYEDTAPRLTKSKTPIEKVRALSTPPARRIERRVLLLGWNHKVPTLLAELDRYGRESVEVTILSRKSIAQRDEHLANRTPLRRVKVLHREGDATIRGAIMRIEPARFDNVVLMSRDWPSTASEADAETLVSYLLLQDVLLEEEPDSMPRIVVELMDATNVTLFAGHPAETVVTSLILGRLLAHVATRRELRALYDELFGPTGPEIAFRRPVIYGIESTAESTFVELERAVADRGDVLIGVWSRQGAEKRRAVLLPEEALRWKLTGRDRLIVLSRVAGDR